MGHTVPSKRYIIYDKLEELMRFAETLRNPYRKRLIERIKSVYENISSLVYVNSLEDDEMIVYAMLARLDMDEKVKRCIAILLK